MEQEPEKMFVLSESQMRQLLDAGRMRPWRDVILPVLVAWGFVTVLTASAFFIHWMFFS